MTEKFVDPTRPDNSGDGLSEPNAWKDPGYAEENSDGNDRINLKASATYTVEHGSNDAILCAVENASDVSPKHYRGYHTTPGDGGIVTFDAQSSLTFCISGPVNYGDHYIFENVHCKNAVSGFDWHEKITVRNGIFEGCSAYGLKVGRYAELLNILTRNNLRGFFGTYNVTVVNMISHSNTDYGGNIQGGSMVNSRFYNNTNIQLQTPTNFQSLLFSNIVLDGNDKTAKGFVITGKASGLVLLNMIICKCSIGIDQENPDEYTGLQQTIRNILYYDNTSDVNNIELVNDQLGSKIATTDPFVNRAAGDYTLTTGSAAKANGIDLGYTDSYWDQYDLDINPPLHETAQGKTFIDMGAIQREEAAIVYSPPTGVGEARIKEKYIHKAIFNHAVSGVSGVHFYYPEYEGDFSDKSSWAMVKVDVDDKLTRGTEYSGKGRVEFYIEARDEGNIHAAKDISFNLSKAIGSKCLTITAGEETVGYISFGKVSSQALGEEAGVLKHYLTSEFTVNTI